MNKLTATSTFECEKSCGNVIQKGSPAWFSNGKMICLECAITEVYGPPPERTLFQND